jgi:hypothetical protein
MRLPRSARTLCACTSLALGGCAGDGATLAYEGPRRPPAEVARLTSGPSVTILQIDGREYSTNDLEILPGEHRVDLKVVLRADELGGVFANERNKDMRLACRADVKFVAEAGVAYRLVKHSRQRGKKYTLRAIHYYHDFGVLLIDTQLDEAIPDAVSQMNCG